MQRFESRAQRALDKHKTSCRRGISGFCEASTFCFLLAVLQFVLWLLKLVNGNGECRQQSWFCPMIIPRRGSAPSLGIRRLPMHRQPQKIRRAKQSPVRTKNKKSSVVSVAELRRTVPGSSEGCVFVEGSLSVLLDGLDIMGVGEWQPRGCRVCTTTINLLSLGEGGIVEDSELVGC